MSSKYLLILYVTHHVEPSKLDEYMSKQRMMRANVVAEDKCVSFHAANKLGEPNVIRIVAMFDGSLEWYQQNIMQRDYYKDFVGWIKEVEAKETIVEAFEHLNEFHYLQAEPDAN